MLSERWVLHSTAKYAELVISQAGFQKPSTALLTKVAEELFREFQSTGIDIPQPLFKKAHRWLASFICLDYLRTYFFSISWNNAFIFETLDRVVEIICGHYSFSYMLPFFVHEWQNAYTIFGTGRTLAVLENFGNSFPYLV